ncbi:MAG: DUF2797 domain-containing protein [Myxococcota bacterium]|nr:DUF2797 domain-containing protein [Myxococcota bacterium]
MKIEGHSRKMRATLGTPIQYQLRLGEQQCVLNDFIGREVQFTFAGQIHCIVCGRRTRKSFAQGFCYPCMQSAPENSDCIIRPELCRGHLGKGRDPEWERRHHVVEHVVYLAVSSAVKVGVTRAEQVPTRWIDQGASQARVLAYTPHRCAAGELEVALKAIFTDRTSWQKMLKNDVLESVDWDDVFDRIAECLDDEYLDHLIDDAEVVDLHYPVEAYPEKVKSLSFDKTPVITGTLQGIKGQYLLLDGHRVLNIRKHNGYHLTFEA